MALTIPAEASALYAPQSAADNVDFAALVAGAGWNGVVTGCAVTAQGSPNMTVAVAAGTVAINGSLVSVSAVASLAIGAASAADRRDIVVVSNLGVVSVVAGTAAGAVNGATQVGSRDPGKPAIPANSVILAEVYVAANTTSIAAGNITDKSLTIPTTAPAGLTVPAGQTLTVGTQSTVTGARTTTTNASDTVNVGTLATTGGALEARIHAHLVAGAAGATASVTKVYEIAAGALMGTLNTWYLCLPVDASANAAATNDFALEVQRTAAGTFQFRFRQKSIAATGVIGFELETLGDTVVAFTPSTTVTAAPTAVTTLHPSNGLCVAAGNVGIGTEAPGTPLSLSGRASIQGSDSSSSLLTATGGPSSTDARFTLVNAAAGGSALLAAISTAGTLVADSAANDAVLAGTAGTLRLGVGSGQSALRITSTDASIYDTGNAAEKSIPRGEVYLNRQTTATVTSTTTGASGAVVLTATGSVVLTNGRKYKVTLSGNASQATAGTGHVRVFAHTANIAVGSTAAGTNLIIAPVQFANGIMSLGQVNYINVQSVGGDLVGGTYFFLVAADTPNAANAITTYGTATSLGQALNILVEDVST